MNDLLPDSLRICVSNDRITPLSRFSSHEPQLRQRQVWPCVLDFSRDVFSATSRRPNVDSADTEGLERENDVELDELASKATYLRQVIPRRDTLRLHYSLHHSPTDNDRHSR